MGRLATGTASSTSANARAGATGGQGHELSTAELRLARSHSSLRRRPRSAWTDWRWTDRHRRLAAHPLLATASRREVRTLARFGEEVEVEAGVPLLSEDSIGRWFVLVLRGNLALTRGGTPVGMLGAGAWVGDQAILGFGPQPASVTTASPCLLFVLGPRPVLSFAIDLPGLRAQLFPGCTEEQALGKARAMRAEGRVRWDRLRPDEPSPALAPRPVPPAPSSHQPSRTLAGAARPFLPAQARPLAPPQQLARQRVSPLAACTLGAIGLFASLTSACLLHLPYHSVEGEARPATDLVTVHGVPVHAPTGELLLLSVDVRHDTALDMLRGWLDADIEVRSTRDVYGDRDPALLRAESLELMERSKDSAVFVARDTVLGIDASEVRIDAHGLGGPSAGLGLALAIVDLVTPGELTGGQRVAVTGTLERDGRVGSVGGIPQKVRAAEAAGARLLLVPKPNLADALAASRTIEVVAVESFSSALAALIDIGGTGLIARMT